MSELNHIVETIDLSTAGSKTLDEFTGMIRWIDTVDSAGAQDLSGKVTIKLGQIKRDGIPFRLNSKLSGETFREMTISWDAQAGLTATFLITPDPKVLDVEAPPSAQLLAGSMSITTPGTVVSTVDQSVAATTSVVLFAANSNRKEALISNNSAADFRIGDINIGASRGFVLKSGASMVLTTDGVIYAYNTSGASASLGKLEVET